MDAGTTGEREGTVARRLLQTGAASAAGDGAAWVRPPGGSEKSSIGPELGILFLGLMHLYVQARDEEVRVPMTTPPQAVANELRPALP